MDLTMQVTFNGQERTLRETVALALSAGWKVVRVTKAPGSLFGHIVAVPVAVPVPPQRRARAAVAPRFSISAWWRRAGAHAEAGRWKWSSARAAAAGRRHSARASTCRPSRRRARGSAPVSVSGGGRLDLVVRRGRVGITRAAAAVEAGCGADGAASKEEEPSPLSVVPPPSSPSPSLYRPVTSPRPAAPATTVIGPSRPASHRPLRLRPNSLSHRLLFLGKHLRPSPCRHASHSVAARHTRT
ncbi:hypothetical protein B0H13DRAFT_811290 [Mycena leptocephala]|nr:hypothetical protein B0H13DRAFT_811290 [Mycena leptocephala]